MTEVGSCGLDLPPVACLDWQECPFGRLKKFKLDWFCKSSLLEVDHFQHPYYPYLPSESTNTNFTEFSVFGGAFNFAALKGASVNRSAETDKTLNFPPVPPATKVESKWFRMKWFRMKMV